MRQQFVEIKNLLKEKLAIRNTYLALAGLIIVVSVSMVFLILASDEEPVSRVVEVRIAKQGFVPSTLAVEAGTSVVWVNNTDGLHQIISNPHASHDDLPDFKSEILNNGQTYEYMFEESGSFNYHDEIKPTLNGTIKVK